MPQSAKSLAPPVTTTGVARLDDVLACMTTHGRSVDPAFLRSVYDFSAEMHKDQTRRSGEPYMIHPLNVAYLLADLKFDQTCVAVGLLHDVLEDTLTTREVLEKEFGGEICGLVDGVTKIGGRLPINTDGGLLANGEPVGASGLRQVYELVQQLRGTIGLQQPTMDPLYATGSKTLPAALGTADVLIQVAKKDAATAAKYPTADYRSMLIAAFPGGAAALSAAAGWGPLLMERWGPAGRRLAGAVAAVCGQSERVDGSDRRQIAADTPIEHRNSGAPGGTPSESRWRGGAPPRQLSGRDQSGNSRRTRGSRGAAAVG